MSSSWLTLIDTLKSMEVYSLLFIGGIIASLFTYFSVFQRIAKLDDNKEMGVDVDSSLLKQPIVFINSGKIIERYMIINYPPKGYGLDKEQIKCELKQKLMEFLK